MGYICPGCSNKLIHSNDTENENGVTYSFYYCTTCNIELYQYHEDQENGS